MGACAERGISLAFCTPRGRFLARIAGSTSGNVLLRRAQYRTADEPSASCRIARSMIFGKVYNARWSIERTRSCLLYTSSLIRHTPFLQNQSYFITIPAITQAPPRP